MKINSILYIKHKQKYQFSVEIGMQCFGDIMLHIWNEENMGPDNHELLTFKLHCTEVLCRLYSKLC